jgi:hypothetical protein
MLRHWLGIIALVFPLACAAATEPNRLFAAHDALEITISAPFRSIARDRDPEPEDRPGTLSYSFRDQADTVAIGVRARGKSRRNRETCDFPPLRLNLPKAEVKGTLFAKQNKLKLVTHCKTRESHQQFLLREYLAYRILNRLTEFSFKVRLVTVNYVDEERGGRTTTRLGFLIEHKDRLARRLDSKLIETSKVDRNTLAADVATLGELYQFLISNTDFSFIAGAAGDNCCHNTVLLASAESTVMPVPYDFDASGLVDAPYAQPVAGLRQRNVKDRVFRGFCRPAPNLDNAVAVLQGAREDLYALVRERVELTAKSQRQVTEFIAGFYRILDDPQLFQRQIAGVCRGGR